MEIAQYHRVELRFAEFDHGVVQERPQLFPVELVFGLIKEFGHGLPFTVLAAGFVAAVIEGKIAGGAAEPAGQRRLLGQAWCQPGRRARESEEHILGDLRREVRRIHLPQRGGVDEVRVPVDEFGEHGLGAALGVVAQQLGVGLRLHLTK